MGDSDDSHGHQTGPVELAHERPFSLGGLNVHPGTLQIEQDGRRDTLEPRVMQVFVACAGWRNLNHSELGEPHKKFNGFIPTPEFMCML
jgi:hypothetical protein